MAKNIFIAAILACITFALSIAYERSRHADISGRPDLKVLADEIEPFSNEFGGMPTKAFDRGAIVGISSSNIGLDHNYPKGRFVEVAVGSGWTGLRETKGPYSASVKFCKNRLSLIATKVKSDYWIYGVYWVSDPQSDLYCGSQTP